MTITTCDRCGKKIQGLDIMRIETSQGGHSSLGKSADLCPKCMNALWRWMDEKAGTEDQGKS